MKWIKDSVRFSGVILALVNRQAFIVLTIIGNTLIFAFSYVFYLLEKNANPAIQSFLDCLWWGFATATTVGYGDITPKTSAGKVLGILLMLAGTAIFAMYTAMFAQTIVEEEFSQHKRK